MISVDAALQKLFSLVTVLPSESVPLAQAAGRVLASDQTAKRNQPPFAASAMDGYAVQSRDARAGATLQVIGESAAGRRFDGTLASGQAVRIFTGAPVPDGADHVVIQEDVTRDDNMITFRQEVGLSTNIRPAGIDFTIGQRASAPRLLRPADIALLAAMNIPSVPVVRRPDIALISTGDELVMPGQNPGPDQIIASNTFGLKALLESHGASVRILPIARDNEASLKTVFDLASSADVIVTIGGASVGDHDLVGKVAQDIGMQREFYKVAMRPGKPLMAGKLGHQAMIGLPGNPVSAMVCGHVFLLPVIRAMLGLGQCPAPRLRTRLAADLPANGPREHYMRAHINDQQLQVFDDQDSSLLSVLAQANALLVCPPDQPALPAGTIVDYLAI